MHVLFAALLAATNPDPLGVSVAFQRYRMFNGLEVILHEDHRLPLVAVNLWYHVGAINEPPGRSGFAHLFEHMMFQGSRNVGDDQHFEYLERAGASEINGTTDFDRTNYFETVPANELALALWLEADRMGFLLDTVTQAKLDNQREVVKNERRESVEDQPYGRCEERLFNTLYPNGHPYHGYVIGSMQDLGNATLADVNDFFRRFYTPANATLVIAGDFQRADVERLIDAYFLPLRGEERPPRVSTPVLPKLQVERIVEPDSVQLARVQLGWVTARAFTAEDAHYELLARVVAGGKSSRLYRRLVYERQIATEVNAYQYSLELGSAFIIEVTARPEHGAAELEAAVDEELAALRAKPPSPDEVERAIATVVLDKVADLQSLGGFGGKADMLQTYNHYLGDAAGFEQDLARFRAASPQALQAAARTLDPARRVTVHCVPREGETE